MPLERVFEFFDRVQARLRARHFGGAIAMSRKRPRQFFLRLRGFSLRIFDASARVEQRLLERGDLLGALAMAMGRTAGGNLRLLGPLARRAQFVVVALGLHP